MYPINIYYAFIYSMPYIEVLKYNNVSKYKYNQVSALKQRC